MERSPAATRPCGHILHTSPDLFLLVHYQPKKDQPNYCRVACEFIDSDDPGKGGGFSVYLSPFDAYIDAAFSSNPRAQYHAIPAYEFDPRELIVSNGGNLHYFLHCGWGASDGQLVTRRKGSLVSLCGVNTLAVSPNAMRAIDLDIDEKDLAHYNRMRESAGLYAHADCRERVLALGERQRMQHVAHAIGSMPGMKPLGCDINQIAMYDFDAAQWHFVPIEVFYSNPDEKEA